MSCVNANSNKMLQKRAGVIHEPAHQHSQPYKRAWQQLVKKAAKAGYQKKKTKNEVFTGGFHL
jgi:hypothetical protein